MAYLAGLSLHAGIREEFEREGGREGGGGGRGLERGLCGAVLLHVSMHMTTPKHRFFLGSLHRLIKSKEIKAKLYSEEKDLIFSPRKSPHICRLRWGDVLLGLASSLSYWYIAVGNTLIAVVLMILKCIPCKNI